jgi:hypothetical protein
MLSIVEVKVFVDSFAILSCTKTVHHIDLNRSKILMFKDEKWKRKWRRWRRETGEGVEKKKQKERRRESGEEEDKKKEEENG